MQFDVQNIIDNNGFELALTGLPGVTVVVPGGWLDITVAYDGGYGLSERLVTARDDMHFMVRDIALRHMGSALSDALITGSSVSDPARTGLSVYARLHPEEAVYIAAVPSGKASQTRLWRVEPDGTLTPVP